MDFRDKNGGLSRMNQVTLSFYIRSIYSNITPWAEKARPRAASAVRNYISPAFDVAEEG
jgi:hypothetical protein